MNSDGLRYTQMNFMMKEIKNSIFICVHPRSSAFICV